MSLENFDSGVTKAAGVAEIGDDASESALHSIGIKSAVHFTTGIMRLELVEAIAEEEFHALATLLDFVGEVVITWDDQTHFFIKIADSDGVARKGFAAWVIRRLELATVPVVDFA